MGLPKGRGTWSGGPNTKGHTILGYVLRSPSWGNYHGCRDICVQRLGITYWGSVGNKGDILYRDVYTGAYTPFLPTQIQ